MPSVSVLPSSPAHRNFGGSPKLPNESDDLGHPHAGHSANTNGDGVGLGSGHGPELTVAEIKDKVRTVVHGFRGASAISLLRAARDQAATGLGLERDDDLRGAYKALLSCAQLSQAVLQHADFKVESEGRKGVVWHEWNEFQERFGNGTIARAKSLEAKLLEMEKDRRDENDRKPHLGSSIADRIKSLQDGGLKVQTTKPLSRDLSTSSSTSFAGGSAVTSVPASNAIARSASHQNHNYNVNSIVSASNSHSSSVANHPTGSSIHSLVSPSSLGPPSPPASSNDLPCLAHYSVSEFTQAFPSIDELDEGMSTVASQLPSVPTNKPGTPTTKYPPVSPSVVQRFPSLPLDLNPGPRPASTPIPPTNVLPSRPPSPGSRTHFQRSPLSPIVPPKPASLHTHATGGSGSSRISPSRTSPMHTGDSTSRGSGRSIELSKTNSVFPKSLHEYFSHGNEVKVLLLDVRTREEFAKGHIKSREVICLEPHILLRDSLTAEQLEDALVVAPQHESALFRNRDKFDLVVMYDWDSESFGPSSAPMATAVRVIFETVAYKRALKRPPAILVGGLKAWIASYPHEVGREDDRSFDRSVPQIDMDLERMRLGSSATATVNGIANGSAYTSTYMLKEQDARSPVSTSHPRVPFTMDQIPEDTSSPTMEANGRPLPEPSRRLVRKPAITRPQSSSSISFNIRGLYDNSSPYINGTNATSSSSIAYPQYPRAPSSAAVSNFGTGQGGIVSPPPTASINPFLSRRRSDYIDQSEQAVSTFASRQSIDYPDLSSQQVVRPPPAVATPPSERQDQRRATSHGSRPSIATLEFPKKPTINSEYPVLYWPDCQFSTSGLKNLGNTCYMNSTIQCLSATVPFARFFTDGRWKNAVNFLNPLGTKGQLTSAFASILHDLWHQESPIITPYAFRKSICMYGQQFAGSEQHDSQEFLNFLLDGLHEDLNRILDKEPIVQTPEREAELEILPQQIASQQEWNLYRTRDDSIVVDFFQGQFRNRMQCMSCGETSTTYNSFMYLTLPIPSGKQHKVTLKQCLDAFVQEEVMEKEDAWQCPNCKTLRKATKKLSISRLPPVLLIHLKRFTTKGHFTDKLETFVDFPLKGLDLTNYMPAPLPPGESRKSTAPISLDDPRTQIPPYRYDLYAVTNHFGTLSSGHYTAFVNSRGNWLYCDDSRISNADAREVVGKPAYVLYYKRVKA